MDTAVHIIVIGYNLPKEEKDCIESIHKNTDHPCGLTFYDNYNTGYTLTYVWNTIIKHSPYKYICLLNNDTIVSPKWLSRMMYTLLNHPQCGFVGPSTNDILTGPSREITTWHQAEEHLGEIEVRESPLAGFCIVFAKELWEKMGGFDEWYTFYGQESDLEDRAMRQGYACVWRKDAFVYHIGEASAKKHHIDIAAERNRARGHYWSTRRR